MFLVRLSSRCEASQDESCQQDTSCCNTIAPLLSFLLFLVRVPLRETVLARLVVPDPRVSCHDMGKQVLARFPVILCSCLRGDRHRGEVVESHDELAIATRRLPATTTCSIIAVMKVPESTGSSATMSAKRSYPKQLRLTFACTAWCCPGSLSLHISASRSRSCTRRIQCSYTAVMFNMSAS